MKDNIPVFLGAITTELLEAEGILGNYDSEIMRKTPTKHFGWVLIHLSSRQPAGGQIVGAAKLISCVLHPDGGYIYSFKDGFYFSAKKLPECSGQSGIWSYRTDHQRKAFSKTSQLLRDHIEESLNPRKGRSDAPDRLPQAHMQTMPKSNRFTT